MACKRYMRYKSLYSDGDRSGTSDWKSYGNDIILIHPNGKVALTGQGGLAVKLKNKTGTPTIKGAVIAPSTTKDKAFILQNEQFDAIGIVYEDGVPDGQDAWVIVAGITQVLLNDGDGVVHGDWMGASTTDGKAYGGPSPGGIGAMEINAHLKEIGHCVESGASNTLVLTVLHFN